MPGDVVDGCSWHPVGPESAKHPAMHRARSPAKSEVAQPLSGPEVERRP